MTQAKRPAVITCARPGCGRRKDVGKSGPIPTYCSPECRAKLSAERAKSDGRYEAELARLRQRTAQRRESQAKPCRYCSAPMANPRRVQCGSVECKRRYYADLQTERSRAIKEATGQWPHRQYAEQQREYDKRRRAEQGHWRVRYPEAAALADARRRLRKEQARTADAFAPIVIHTRDNWTCRLCLLPIDPGVAWPDRMSPSIDHVIPLSRGGTHSMSNVQSAHLGCNSRKRDKVSEAS